MLYTLALNFIKKGGCSLDIIRHNVLCLPKAVSIYLQAFDLIFHLHAQNRQEPLRVSQYYYTD